MPDYFAFNADDTDAQSAAHDTHSESAKTKKKGKQRFPLRCDHGRGYGVAQLDLTNRLAGCIHLPENHRRSAQRKSQPSARHRVAASPDVNGRRDGIEIRLESNSEWEPNLYSGETVQMAR